MKLNIADTAAEEHIDTKNSRELYPESEEVLQLTEKLSVRLDNLTNGKLSEEMVAGIIAGLETVEDLSSSGLNEIERIVADSLSEELKKHQGNPEIAEHAYQQLRTTMIISLTPLTPQIKISKDEIQIRDTIKKERISIFTTLHGKND